MIKIAVISLFVLLLFMSAYSTSHLDITIQFFPLTRPITMSTGSAIMLSSLAGVLVTTILALLDRVQLMSANKKMKVELKRLEDEIASLRQIVTQEREDE